MTSPTQRSTAAIPNDFISRAEVQDRLLAFQHRYQQIARPFQWTFTRQDLAALLVQLEQKAFAKAA